MMVDEQRRGGNPVGFDLTLHLPHVDALKDVVAILKEHSFGVLTEIDVKGTMKQELDVDFRLHTVLGACNPPLVRRCGRHRSRNESAVPTTVESSSR